MNMRTVYVSLYADCAVLDVSPYLSHLNHDHGGEENEGTATVRVRIPSNVYARLLNYCQGGNTDGFDDAYQAADAIRQHASMIELVDCDTCNGTQDHCPMCMSEREEPGDIPEHEDFRTYE